MYADQLIALLPQGGAWPRDPDGPIYSLMVGLSQELQRIDDRAAQLLRESLPSEISDTLEHWETDLGLPEGCNPPDDIAQRLASVQQKHRMYGSQSRVFFKQLAEAFGVTTEISEYTESTFGGDFGGPFTGRDWVFVVELIINSLNTPEEQLTRVEQTVLRYLHAHKVLISQRHETRNISINGQLLSLGDTPIVTTIETTRSINAQSCN
jgi:uncharacterized protein YmfQ (DUF2313 family)